MDEIRKAKRKVSKRLLEAQKREGSFMPELARMERDARAWMRKKLNGRGRRLTKPSQ